MRLLTMILVLILLNLSAGCGSGRPDPRKNPDFNQESYENVDALSDELKPEAAQ